MATIISHPKHHLGYKFDISSLNRCLEWSLEQNTWEVLVLFLLWQSKILDLNASLGPILTLQCTTTLRCHLTKHLMGGNPYLWFVMKYHLVINHPWRKCCKEGINCWTNSKWIWWNLNSIWNIMPIKGGDMSS